MSFSINGCFFTVAISEFLYSVFSFLEGARQPFVDLLYLVGVETARGVSGLVVIGRIISRGMILIVGVEGGYASARGAYIIIGKLSDRKEIILVVYLFINKRSKLYLKLLVKNFSLAVSRGIKGSTYP